MSRDGIGTQLSTISTKGENTTNYWNYYLNAFLVDREVWESITRQFNKATISRRFKMAPTITVSCMTPAIAATSRMMSSLDCQSLKKIVVAISTNSFGIICGICTLAPALCFQAHQFFRAIKILRLAS
ncbi:hypothetical protein BT96DRAFT_949764 [Gymnopus androsaceus JB14]|uniref:Uncharacterized protein n=1 Tax=Gymnopus androsaceus JB14 TaxID=1447944 RepID=A0A6A4GJ60_9AGAR|nr:hypothetical protein BT96DRAFT_949764 [Gymnopus androsaceus JB14]